MDRPRAMTAKNGGMLFEGLHESGYRLGIVGGKAVHRLLVRGLLGVISLGQQAGNLILVQTGSLQSRTHLSLAFGPVAGGTLRLVDSSTILRERGLRKNQGETEHDCKKYDE